MSELKTRVKLLYRTYAQWKQYETNSFVLLRGETCFCEVPKDSVVEGIDTSVDRILIKVGDGTSSFAQLKWLSALPATKVGANTKYKVTKTAEGLWKLQVSIDDGDWQDIVGSATIDITDALNRIAIIEGKVDSITTSLSNIEARLATAEQNIADIKRLSEEEIHYVID